MKISITVEDLSLDEALLFLAQKAEDGAPSLPVENVAAEVHEAAKAAAKLPASRIPPTPAVKKLIDAAEVDWRDIPGTGKEGRITQQDVNKYIRLNLTPPAEQADPPVVPDSGEAEGAPPAITEVRDALKALNGSKGMSACLEVLAKFGVKKIGELAEKDYANFIAATK